MSEKGLNKLDIKTLPSKEFKVMIIKTLNEFGRRIDEHSENFNRVKNYKAEPNKDEKFRN